MRTKQVSVAVAAAAAAALLVAVYPPASGARHVQAADGEVLCAQVTFDESQVGPKVCVPLPVPLPDPLI